MKIIISPAKQMRIDTESGYGSTIPVYMRETEQIVARLQSMSYAELKNVWKCNDKIAEQNFQRIKNMDLGNNVTPAVLAYDGLQYTHMGPNVFDGDAWEYICRNLFILSGFYGILRACDGIVPYRLEMQAKIAVGEAADLYKYWGSKLYDRLTRDDKVILNLASKEYSKAVEPFITEDICFVTCVFAEGTQESYKVKATEAKMARGYMVNWCAHHNITAIEDVKNFSGFGYKFCENLSDKTKYVFLKIPKQRI